jgi:hypothetical protein
VGENNKNFQRIRQKSFKTILRKMLKPTPPFFPEIVSLLIRLNTQVHQPATQKEA